MLIEVIPSVGSLSCRPMHSQVELAARLPDAESEHRNPVQWIDISACVYAIAANPIKSMRRTQIILRL